MHFLVHLLVLLAIVVNSGSNVRQKNVYGKPYTYVCTASRTLPYTHVRLLPYTSRLDELDCFMLFVKPQIKSDQLINVSRQQLSAMAVNAPIRKIRARPPRVLPSGCDSALPPPGPRRSPRVEHSAPHARVKGNNIGSVPNLNQKWPIRKCPPCL